MEKQSVRDLKDKDTVDSLFLVKEKNVNVGKNGRPFMSLLLGDQTGSIDGRLWDRVEELNQEFEAGDIIQVKGQIQLFQNRKQLIVHRIEKPDQSTLNIEDFIPASGKNANDMFTELLLVVRSMKNDHLRQLTMDVIEDPEIKPLFMKAPAAKTIHHAWRGGLLEHVLSICKILDFLAGHYSFLNRDLLIFGGIFHDIGKVWELSYDGSLGYTDKGRLLGHMLLACELVEKKASRILGFSEELKDMCKHIILSHHGKLEYGSPKRPKFMEAALVAMVDDLDSKMNTIQTFIESERNVGDKWSRYNDLFDRYFLLDNLKERY
ncbi:3'-5' exoribonuclease YhaM family protein [Bdellovibrio sp. HCB337]|uniref:3'-5' exoribonuclease YhaM family protein n=1 Tax=Bdellovibrio sp. HCB337 TaxID=3394358 RepID=UPI0039A4A07F